MISGLRKKPSVFVADLTCDTNIVSSEFFPPGIGYVIANAKKMMAGEVSIE